jgi:ElaB/YqjD/DUF883 family membrane-anchored ribosome-binding protein
MKNGNGKFETWKSNETIQRLIEKMTEGTEQIKTKAQEWGLGEVVTEVQSYVRRHPWRSIGIASGIGLIAGLLLKPTRTVEIRKDSPQRHI